MYTQCPDCSTAFRVTAEILKKAAGKVRCGGCGNAFNALLYLSETMPEQAPRRAAEDDLPELTPEPLEGKDGLPASISAEQSAALLKTLDELAGSDIRIEDTGVEWRVLDDDELGEAAADEVDVEIEDQPKIDEILEDSPTPVDQFLTSTPPQVDSPEIFAGEDDRPSHKSVDELRFDDNTPLPDDFDLDSAPAPAPEPESQPEPVIEAAPQADLDLSEPDEWTDILDEFEVLADELGDPEPSVADELDSPDGIDQDDEAATAFAKDDEDSVDEPLDMDAQFALQAEAMGINLSGIHEAPAEEPADTTADDIESLLEASSEEARDLEDLLEEEFVDDGTVGELDVELEVDASGEYENAEADSDEYELEDEGEDEDEDEIAQLELIDDDASAADLQLDDEPADDDESSAEVYVPPLTEEEQTINLQIDQDLLAIAVEDEDGFASTMVLAEASDEDAAKARQKDGNDDEDVEDDAEAAREHALKDTSAGFETIIMEGEAFRSALDDDEQEDRKAAAAASLADAAAERAAKEAAQAAGKRNYGLVAGVAILVLVLVGQFVHQARNTLATIPAFNSVVGPMYRAIGQPLSPDWDVTGWRFEVTKGSTDEENNALTVYSRIGNKSDTPLPYPLIGISLTDRFEETIGSRILDPAEYLSSDLDPRKLVQPGNTFNAVITIESPSEEATGFKLHVCYRDAGGSLRCAIEDFK